MASTHFANLDASIKELKRIYLDNALVNPGPTPDQQELARAFVTLAHAELEYFVEQALGDLAGVVLANAAVGSYGKASLALLAFSGVPPLNGGASLSTGKKKAPRKLSQRFGEAHGLIVQKLQSNCGIREKHLAAMGVPLGLEADNIDNTWLSDLDTFCSYRGAFAHMSRTSQRASHLAVNPQDVWLKCERLVWFNSRFANVTQINSFEQLDSWIGNEVNSFGPVVSSTWRLKLRHMLVSLSSCLGRRSGIDTDED